MTRPRVRRLFQVLPEEGGKVLAFSVLAALLQAGIAIGMVVADSVFIAELGIAELPLVFIFMPLLMAVYAPLYSFLVERLGTRTLFQLTLAALVVGGVFFGVAGNYFGEERWFLFAMRFYAGLWFIALYTLFWNFADDYFSILDSKRLYGLISAGGSVGATIGGGLVTALSGWLAPAAMFLFWSLFALLTWPVLVLLLRRYRPIATDDAGLEQASSLPKLVGFMVTTLRGSRFATALAAICFLMISLTAVLEYLSMGVFAAGRDAAELASLLGALYATAGVLTLMINLLVFNRVVGWLGVGATALVVPFCYLGAFVMLFLQPGVAAAVVAFYAYQSLFVSIEYNNINLLYNALPARVKPQLRTFIEAMAEPAAMATAGVLLLYSAEQFDPTLLALAGLLATCVALLVAAIIRSDYVRSLARNLRDDWLDFANPEAGWRRQLGGGDLLRLRQIAASGDREQRLLAVDLLWRLHDEAARESLLAFLSEASAAEAERLRPAIAGLLREDDTETLAETLLWLESDRAPCDPDVLEEFTGSGAFPVRQLESWRHSSEPSHQAALAVARWSGTRLEDVAAAIDNIRALLSGDRLSRRMAIRAIGDCRHSRYYTELLPFLRGDDALLRLEALRSMRKLASPETTQLLSQVVPLLRDAASEERLLILEIAARTADTSAIQALLWSAEHFSAAESRRLEAVIRSMGLKAIPGVIHVLRDAGAPYHSRAIGLRALSRLAMPQLAMVSEELIEHELRRAEAAVRAHRSLLDGQTGVGQEVLTRYYRDAAAQGLEFVLEVLSLTGRLLDFDLIRATLAFANSRDRANAIETIQQSCSKKLFERLCRLIDATIPGSGLDVIDSDARLPVETVLHDAACSQVPLEASAALIAYRDRGLSEPAMALLRQRLDQAGSGRINDWLVALLPLFAPELAEVGQGSHPVERVACLLRAEYFGTARILALDYLAHHAEERQWQANAVIYTAENVADELYIVAEGEVELHHSRAIEVAAPGSAFGQRVLMGDAARGERAVSRGCRAIALRRDSVRRAIEIFPSMGVSLYQFKTIPAPA